MKDMRNRFAEFYMGKGRTKFPDFPNYQMGRMGDGVAVTRAFPSATWERGDGDSRVTLIFHEAEVPAGENVDEYDNRKDEQKPNETTARAHPDCGDKMENIETGPGKSCENVAPFQHRVGLNVRGCNENAAENKRKHDDAQDIGIRERHGKRTDREDREPTDQPEPYTRRWRGSLYERRLQGIGHEEEYGGAGVATREKAGSETAPTLAFPSATWERGDFKERLSPPGARACAGYLLK